MTLDFANLCFPRDSGKAPGKLCDSPGKALKRLVGSRDVWDDSRMCPEELLDTSRTRSTVAAQQLCRVSTWQRQEAGTAKFTFLTQQNMKSIIYCVLWIFAIVSHFWVTNLSSCHWKGSFQATFCPITAAPSPLLLPPLRRQEPERKEDKAQASLVPPHLSSLPLFLHRISDFTHTQFLSELLLHV